MNIPFSPPDMSEAECNEVCDALRSGWITTGPKTKAFEQELAQYCHTNKVVALNSATAAMELTLRLLGVGVGDEVIVPAYTYTATCSVVCHVGATPVMVDLGSSGFEMDYEKLQAAITERTKVIIPVDIAGILCDYDMIYRIVEKKKALFHPTNDLQKAYQRIIVLADCAHGFGAVQKGIRAGGLADFTCFSFHAVKNLTTAEGGAVTWRFIPDFLDAWIYEQFQLMSLHGQTKDALSKTTLGAWEYDVVAPLYKCNMTDIHAAIGRVQLQRYPQMLKRRHAIIQRYNDAFLPLHLDVLSHHDETHTSSGHLYMIRVPGIDLQQRSAIITELAKRGIASNVHYKPLPLLSAYKNMGFAMEDYPQAYAHYENEITLPLYSRLRDEEVAYIIQHVCDVLQGYLCA